jgi:hypothetical protein
MMYQEIHDASFYFKHYWNKLRCHSKRKRSVTERKEKSKRKSFAQESPSTPESINLGEDNVSLNVCRLGDNN